MSSYGAQAIIFRYEENWSPCEGLRQSDLIPLELGLEVGAEGIQHLLRQVVSKALRQLLAIKELNGHVLQTMAGHRLWICLRKNLH